MLKFTFTVSFDFWNLFKIRLVDWKKFSSNENFFFKNDPFLVKSDVNSPSEQIWEWEVMQVSLKQSSLNHKYHCRDQSSNMGNL